MAYKPGSVIADGYSSDDNIYILPIATYPMIRKLRRQNHPIWSCCEWGLPMPNKLPCLRCALTAPFHPYHNLQNGGYFLWHFPLIA